MSALLLLEIEESAIAHYPISICSTGENSGFDLYMPADITLLPRTMSLVDLGVRCELNRSHGYYLYPRSSISKTPLRLANSVGIIDAGYRGTLKVAVENNSDMPYHIKKGDRFFQICLPSLEPFNISYGRVNRETVRGEGGFGSSNRA